MGRVQQRFAQSGTGGRNAWRTSSTTSQRRWSSNDDEFHDAHDQEVPAGSAAQEAPDDDDDEAEDEQGQSQWSWGSHWDSWQDYGSDSWSYRWRNSSSRTASYVSGDAAWVSQAPELLPEFVQGWFLLQDSGLDTNEKNMVIAALGGDYSLPRVAQELRNQWVDVDDDLRRRDQGGRSTGWMLHDDDRGDPRHELLGRSWVE